jgi:hypothetical protein
MSVPSFGEKIEEIVQGRPASFWEKETVEDGLAFPVWSECLQVIKAGGSYCLMSAIYANGAGSTVLTRTDCLLKNRRMEPGPVREPPNPENLNEVCSASYVIKSVRKVS